METEKQQAAERAFLNSLNKLFTASDVFYENAFVFCTTFSLLKLDSFLRDSVMATFLESLMAVARCCSHFQGLQVSSSAEDKNQPLSVRCSAPTFLASIEKLFRMIAWLIGQTAYRLVQVQKMQEASDAAEPAPAAKKKKKEKQKQEAMLNIQESRLLSGGIEPKHLVSLISKETQSELQTYLQIIDDAILTQSFQAAEGPSQSEASEDDRILEAIIEAGKDKTTDLLITCLQKALEAKVGMARAQLARANGLALTRAAFAPLIKFSDLLEDFVSLVDQLQFFNEVEDKASDLPALLAFLRELPQFSVVVRRWEAASKMRQWINDSKSRMTDKYEQEAKEELLKSKIKQAKEQAKASPAEQQIDSTGAQ